MVAVGSMVENISMPWWVLERNGDRLEEKVEGAAGKTRVSLVLYRKVKFQK